MTPTEPSPLAEQDAAVLASLDSRSMARGTEAAEPPESKSALLIFGFVEFHRLLQEGQPPDIYEWCDNFSACRSSLLRLLQVEAALASGVVDVANHSCDESVAWPSTGERRQGFTIVRELARGTFARVYLATEAATGDRLVVLKCSTFGAAEARTMGRLSHPGIVPILSARHDARAGLYLVCMPYLGSATLEDVVDRVWMPSAGSLPSKAAFLLDVIRSCAQPEDPPAPRTAERLQRSSYTDGIIHLTVQLAETLAFLHEQGVCHRDLKPSNVLLDPSGKPLLLDFNLSHNEREAVTPLGGTLRYMAPEQLRAFLDGCRGNLDERADLYALAVIVYELLAGASPHGNLRGVSGQAQLLLERQQAGCQSFRRICPELERPVAAILDHCLAFDVADRPRSAGELAAELKRQFKPARRLRRWLAARRRWVVTALCLFFVATTVLASVWAMLPPYSQREYDRGRMAYHAGDYAAAEGHFDRALRAEPNHERFRYARGCARLQHSKYLPVDQVKFDPILDDLTSHIPGPADPRTLAVHAYVQIRNQKYDKAIKKYNLIYRSGYRPVMVLNNRAYAYLSMFQWEKARIDLDKAVQLDPHCQAARYNRAWIAIQLRLAEKITAIPSQVLADIEQAVQIGPTTSTLLRDAAGLYALAANEDLRQPHFERALSYLHQAISAGEPAASFNTFPSLREALQRPEFQSLLKTRQAQDLSQPNLRLLDPVEMLD